MTNFLILGPSTTAGDYGLGGFSYLLKMSNSLKKTEGNNIVFAFENRFNSEASFVNFSKEKVYYFSDWSNGFSEDQSNLFVEKYSNEIAYINYERLRCIKANNSIRNYKWHIENNIIQKIYHFFSELIEKEKINCIVYETVSTLFCHIAYLVSKEKGIPYLGWLTSRIPGRFDLLGDPYGDIEKLNDSFKQIRLEEIEQTELNSIQNYIENIGKVKPDYMKNNPWDMNKNFIIRYIKKGTKFFKLLSVTFKLKTDLKNDYYAAHPLEQKYCYARYRIGRQMRVMKIKKHFVNINENDNYFLFPLHFQPEASTGVCAPFYCNQVDVVRNIAFSLPVGTMLYVKDHPNGIGFMSLKEYKQIFGLPNVKYISPEANNKELISRSLGVVTITSTMGYEALLMQKPVLTLGKVFYNAHPYCNHILGYEQLPETLKNMLHEKHDDFESVNIRFVKAYRDTNFEGHLLSEKEEDIDKIADVILKVVTREKKSRELHNG